MPVVWMRSDPRRRARFHRTPDCTHLTRPPSMGDHDPLIAIDLEEVAARPCRICYPDAPRIKVIKAYCEICRSRMPCEHNGGVRIVRRHGRPYWVWPDTNQMPYFRRTSA